eukprot:scaffold71564_cov73-Phaeocystis_antarctica.AAC.3
MGGRCFSAAAEATSFTFIEERFAKPKPTPKFKPDPNPDPNPDPKPKANPYPNPEPKPTPNQERFGGPAQKAAARSFQRAVWP